MEYTHVGHLGLVVSRLCLGAMNFGPHTPESDSYTIMDSAVAYGINFFDTANVFGRHLGVGATEEIIGRWFTKGDRRRDKVVLATKVYGTMGDWPNESRLSKLGIVRQCEESLRRLRTDRIDLYQMHHIGRQSQGYMVGEIDSNRPKLDQWETLCKELGHRPADVALAWLLHQPAVTAPVIGPRTEAQLLGSMRALGIEMSEEVLGKLDEIFPGPGGPAPEAYAW